MKPRLLLLLTLVLALAATGCGANINTVTVTPTNTPLPTDTPTITPDIPATETQVAQELEQTALAETATAEFALNATGTSVAQEALNAQATLDTAATMTEVARPTETPVPTDTPVPTETPIPSPTPLPSPTAIAWLTIDVPELNIELSVPADLDGPTLLDQESVLFGDTQSQYIVITRTIINRDEFGLDQTAGPVEALTAAVADTVENMGAAVVTEPVDFATPQGIPAGFAQLTFEAYGVDVAFVLYHFAPDDWILLNFSGTADEIAMWLEPLVASVNIRPLPQPAFLPQDEAPTAESVADALGLDFTVPEDWQINISEGSTFAIAPVEFAAPGEDDQRAIALVRGTTEEFTELGFPQGENDPLKLLEGLANYTIEQSNEGFKSGRYNEIAIGEFIGAWTQLRNDDTTLRFYLFPAGAAEWLVIGARGNRDTFNAFNRAELKDFLDSLALRPDEGVALGLDFVVPEGWQYTKLEDGAGFTGEAVRLAPADDNPDNRSILFARGAADDFTAIQFPAETTDSAVALQPIAEFIRVEENLGNRLRVEDVQIGDFRGSIANLRGENTAMRLYLFNLGTDDWLFVAASADRAAFNTFNREELREVMGSLALASGNMGALTVQPIGPIEEVVVTHVSDGDTIYVMLNGVEESVRIIGMDTPEAHHPDSGADWLGYTATNFMADLIHEGDTVWLESDIRDRDDFLRLLRYVWTKDEAGNWQMIEAALIRAGLAHVRTYDEDRYVPYFMALEREAMAEKLGVWGDPPPPPLFESLATRNDVVWAANPDADEVPLLFDAAALGNVPDPVASWPNNITAVVRDVYYVYPTDIDPVTDAPVSEDKVGYWYWLEINDFRGWVPERWLMLDEPENAVPGPDTDIIAYAEPFVVSEGPVDVLDAPVDGEVLGTFEPESRVQARRISMDIATGDWWMYVQTQTLDGWLPLANLNRLSPEYR